MRKKYSLLCIFLLISFSALAQQFTLTGKVYDKTSDKPLEAATVFLKSVKDSSLVNYTICDNKGVFNLKAKSSESVFDLFITHIGNAPYKKRIEKPKGTLDLGRVELETQAQELEEVTLTSEAIPITVKKDTLEFNADAFKLRPDATVEELLKNLPGVEVDSKGNITVNGTSVNEILVNGKPFFDDPKIATKNLTKDIVKKIQVSDTKTKEQKFTKEQGDSDNKSINIVLKEDKNKGYFGRATVGYGTKDRYELNGFGNYFQDKTRVSILGSSNNINTLGFQFDEVFGMMGDVQDVWMSKGNISINGMNFGGGDGFNKSHIGGVSYVDEYGKNIEVDANYFYSHNDNENYSRNDRETTLPDRHYFSRNEQWNNSWSEGHSARAELEYKIDSLTQISVSPQLSVNRGNNHNRSEETSYDNQKSIVNQSISKSNSQNYGITFNNRVSFNRRFKGTKGSWGVSLGNKNSRSEKEQTLYNTREIFGSNPSIQVRDQQQDTDNQSDNYYLRANLRYPLYKDFLLKAGYNFSKTDTKSNVNTYDADSNGNYLNFNTLLSSDFLTENTRHQPEIGVEWQRGKFRLNSDVGMIYNRLENQDFLRNLALDKNFQNPNLRLRASYEIKKGTTLNFNYNTQTRVPSVNQLQPIDNVNNPLHTFTGNPDLKPTFTNIFRLDFNNYDFETRSGIFATLRTEFQQDKITSVTLTNSDLTRKTTYTNIDGDFLVRGGANYRKSYKIEEHKIGYRLGTWGRIGKSNLFSNGTRYVITNYSVTPSLTLEYEWEAKIDFYLEYNPSFNKAKYNLDVFENQDYTEQRASLQLTTYVPKNVIFGNDIEFSYAPYLSDGFRKTSFYWNMSLGYKFLNEKATIQLKAYDLLNQTVEAWRTITQDYVQDSQKLVLKQYFMLSFSYKFNKAGGKGH
ncbi:outer membrane beta-barrel protein [Capnocytophaga sp.]|uniref:outer membrane beta-barrel protein n=1 Tax=Capnocytophaga sp. TaxID=44737 RepID=UPI0026DB87FC|nr:outer membrane beta-barrel protein [Capnocytophaga sp.]MDO5106572.1 outer membrane beta-barrel protein [Capnocytophaga sp.]